MYSFSFLFSIILFSFFFLFIDFFFKTNKNNRERCKRYCESNENVIAVPLGEDAPVDDIDDGNYADDEAGPEEPPTKVGFCCCFD